MINFIVQNKDSNYKIRVNNIIESRKKEIFNSGAIELDFNIYIYNSLEDLVFGMKERGFKDMPDYMCACQKDEDNSINFFEPKDNPNEDEWSKDEYDNIIFHELIHGMQYKIFGETPEWLNEGIAKCLDGTYTKGISWLLKNYINNNEIPDQNEIENEFGEHEYDSYDYAYIMVSYIIDTKGKAYLIELLSDSEKLAKEKENLLNKAIEYYNKKAI